MEPNVQGFLYPVVDDKKCIDCGKCLKVCAFNKGNTQISGNEVLLAYAVKHLNEGVRAVSRSGGMFTALSDSVLSNGGVIYGCALQDNRKALHVRAEVQEKRNECRGSKYVQSRIDGVLEQVRFDLQQGKTVLFSGTSCQVDAVAQYCKDYRKNLLLVDIVCYGVASPKVWEDYLFYLSKKYRKKIATVEFRDKGKFGWAAHYETVRFTDGTEYSGEVFSKLYGMRCALRKDCFACPYKNLNRVGDITLADCWGVSKYYPEFSDNKGISLVLINNEKGREYFTRINDVLWIPVDVEKLLQPALKENWKIPEWYKEFWNDYSRYSFGKTIKKYLFPDERLTTRVKIAMYKFWGRIKRFFHR